MPARTTRRALALAAVTALAGCGLTATDTTGPTTTAGRPFVPTTAAVGAPTTAGGATPTTAAAGGDPAGATTTVVASSTTAPATVVGPPLNLVTLVESPAETRKQPSTVGIDGVLVQASNPAHSRSFVFSTYERDLSQLRTAPGWSFTVLSRDRQWTPASCGATASVFVGRRWEVYVDTPTMNADGFPSPTARDVQLVSFDVTTKAFASYLETPNKVTWFTNNLQALDDHTVGILFDPDPAQLELRTTLALRRIDLLNGRVNDERIELPQGGTYNYPFLGHDGSITLYGLNTDQVLFRPAGGQFTVLPLDGVRAEKLVDGLYLDWSGVSSDPNNDVSLVDLQGNLSAKVHSWRFAANGPGIGYFGFADARGYFGAFTEQGVTGRLNLGVYDTSTATWDWVFDAASPIFADGGGANFFVAGTA